MRLCLNRQRMPARCQEWPRWDTIQRHPLNILIYQVTSLVIHSNCLTQNRKIRGVSHIGWDTSRFRRREPFGKVTRKGTGTGQSNWKIFLSCNGCILFSLTCDSDGNEIKWFRLCVYQSKEKCHGIRSFWAKQKKEERQAEKILTQKETHLPFRYEEFCIRVYKSSNLSESRDNQVHDLVFNVKTSKRQGKIFPGRNLKGENHAYDHGQISSSWRCHPYVLRKNKYRNSIQYLQKPGQRV